MTTREHPAKSPLLQTVPQEETATLAVAQSHFDGFVKSSFDELTAGDSSKRVLTYSSSTPITNRTAGESESLPSVGGHPYIPGAMVCGWKSNLVTVCPISERTLGAGHGR